MVTTVAKEILEPSQRDVFNHLTQMETATACNFKNSLKDWLLDWSHGMAWREKGGTCRGKWENGNKEGPHHSSSSTDTAGDEKTTFKAQW
ncbi:CMT1A duplicated region transcript 4 protein isoform X4 [Mauremys reevesii]|uniref:CMT1A duplicated region transcript 4 protein isoform X4 n=1 Tax=Mauremys reevesii TaxID=260615 RepID=UPI00193EEC70|nr:CMT1A duplicated region transcript 4 protein isoform X4 [Mauremys reevesii]